MGCGLVSIDCYGWHCVRQGSRICSKCKHKSCTIVWFSTRSVLNIQPISLCHISNERKQIFDQVYYLLFLSRGYAFLVMIEWIYCTVTFFAHCKTWWEFDVHPGHLLVLGVYKLWFIDNKHSHHNFTVTLSIIAHINYHYSSCSTCELFWEWRVQCWLTEKRRMRGWEYLNRPLTIHSWHLR